MLEFGSRNDTFFVMMVDDLVQFAPHDPELADSIKWLDEQAHKKGITFYDMVFDVLYKYDVNQKATDWLKTRN